MEQGGGRKDERAPFQYSFHARRGALLSAGTYLP
jgi:hypothetical protein